MENKKIKAGVIGGAGYTGGETVRLLVNHPRVSLSFVQSRSQAGKQVSDVHRDLLGDVDLTFIEVPDYDVDVLFLCLGHGESKVYLADNPIPSSVKIIDLSQDFRLGEKSGDRLFIYGLPEYQKNEIIKAGHIANPGCFATAIQLGLLPLADKKELTEVYTTGITGSTGAGQKLQETSHFSWRMNNISAYKTLTHQHLKEINQTLIKLQPDFKKTLHFVPWRGDFARGIFVSSTLNTKIKLDELYNMYQLYYKDAPFTFISDKMIDLKQVINTNKCVIHLEQSDNQLVVHSAIDNLIKGASGQAVQNMNLMFGFEETAGLKLKSIVH